MLGVEQQLKKRTADNLEKILLPNILLKLRCFFSERVLDTLTDYPFISIEINSCYDRMFMIKCLIAKLHIDF